MHWSKEIAQKVIDRNPSKEEYVCAAGISPSGSIHIGNFRDVVTSYFVVKALRKMGKRARLLFSWDEFDRLRKVPQNVAILEADYNFNKMIGCPYIDIKNPFDDDASNYAAHFEKEFENSINEFCIDIDYRYQANMYRSGKYAEYVIIALKKRYEIFDILAKFKTQASSSAKEREEYMPVSIYCDQCGKDTTKITQLSNNCERAEYTCKCGHHSDFDFTKDFNCKLAWKIDWPMRWRYEGVDFEPGGKDHASPLGSYQASRIISEKIFNYPAPIFQGYEFIGIKGVTGKMSGSSGLNLTPTTLLKLYQPEVILWLYSKTEPMKAFDFCFNDGILRHYFEFDKMYDSYINGTADEYISAIMQNCIIEGRRLETVPMPLLVQLGSIVNFNIPMVEMIFKKIGKDYKYKQFADRLERAKYWLKNCSPEDIICLNSVRNFKAYEALDTDQKKEITLLYQYLKNEEYDLDKLNVILYNIPKQVYGATINATEIQNKQKTFFKNVYTLLINREKGPRLYLFLFAIDKEQYLPLLDFSKSNTKQEQVDVQKQEMKRNEIEQTKATPKKIYTEPDPVELIKPKIDLDDFLKIDFRVCKIIKCLEIRKSNNNLKLVVFDGINNRTIVSSIRNEYTSEQLINKKIIVIANLVPKRIEGITSEGMLIAGTNSACGVKVVFVDDSVPEGTIIR